MVSLDKELYRRAVGRHTETFAINKSVEMQQARARIKKATVPWPRRGEPILTVPDILTKVNIP